MGLSLFTPTVLLSHGTQRKLLSRHNNLSPVWLRAPDGLYQGFLRWRHIPLRLCLTEAVTQGLSTRVPGCLSWAGNRAECWAVLPKE